MLILITVIVLGSLMMYTAGNTISENVKSKVIIQNEYVSKTVTTVYRESISE
jgi:hypothetical protein